MLITRLPKSFESLLYIRNAITLNAFKVSFIEVFAYGPLFLYGIEFLRIYYQASQTVYD